MDPYGKLHDAGYQVSSSTKTKRRPDDVRPISKGVASAARIEAATNLNGNGPRVRGVDTKLSTS